MDPFGVGCTSCSSIGFALGTAASTAASLVPATAKVVTATGTAKAVAAATAGVASAGSVLLPACAVVGGLWWVSSLSWDLFGFQPCSTASRISDTWENWESTSLQHAGSLQEVGLHLEEELNQGAFGTVLAGTSTAGGRQ